MPPIQIFEGHYGRLDFPPDLLRHIHRDLPTQLRLIHWSAEAPWPDSTDPVERRKPFRYEQIPIVGPSARRGRFASVAGQFAPYFIAALQKRSVNYVVQTEEQRLPSADNAVTTDSVLSGLLATSNRGLIRFDPSRVSPQVVIQDILRSRPSQKALIVTKTIEEAITFGHQLRISDNSCSIFAGKLKESDEAQIAVGTLGGIGSDGYHAIRPIVIFVDALILFQKFPHYVFHNNIDASDSTVRKTLWGLLPMIEPANRLDEYLLFSTFGANQFWLPGENRVPRPVSVAWLTVSNRPASPSGSAIHDLKDVFVYRNAQRNRLIGEVVAAAISGDTGRLARLLRVPMPENAMIGRVLVVADTPIQQRFLSRCLLKGSSALGRCVVVTMSDLKRQNIDDFDLLVRADAGVGGLPVQTRSWSTDPRAPRPLLLVDVNDRSQPALKDRFQQRLEDYKAQGWHLATDREYDRVLRTAFWPTRDDMRLIEKLNTDARADVPRRGSTLSAKLPTTPSSLQPAAESEQTCPG